jgi:diguanylate cyclase (GGDEF)-like protein
MNKGIHILIVEDDANMRETLSDILNEEDYLITGVGTIKSAKEELKNKFYNLVLLDLKLPNGTGLDLLKEIKQLNEETMVIVFTGFASLESAVSAMNQGAFSYLQKPLNIDELKIGIKKALKMQELSLSNQNLIARLQDLSLKEPLTGLYNYRYLRERLSSEFKRAKRYIFPLSLIMLDIDYFKSINDIYGHRYGDLILKEFAQELLNCSRTNDVVIRYGGDEFIVLLPDTNREGAVIFAKRLFSALTEYTFDQKNNRIKLKVSMGLSSFPEGGVNTESGFLDSADQALRGAKEKGGNRVFVFKSANEKELETLLKAGKEENIDKLKEKLLQMENRVNQTLLESIYAFAKTIEAKDYYTGEHAENMVSIVVGIAKELNLPEKEIENLEHAAALHDLGKIGVPDNILQKKGKLTKEEHKAIEKHPQIGAEIIRPVHFLSEVVPIVLYHHERYDGLGYSAGLKGKEIPLGARIIAVADVYQALISDRPYRKAYSKEESLKIIEENAGTHFDPEVVKAFMKTIQPKMQEDRDAKEN